MPTRAVVAPAISALALVTGVAAVATWGDGDPGPWIWISMVAAPLGIVAGIAAWSLRSGKVALAISLLVAAVWLFVFYSVASGDS